jgi:hypothetical protein
MWYHGLVFVGASQQVQSRLGDPSPRFAASLDEVQGWVGNSYTGDYAGDQGVAGGIELVLNGEEPSHTADLNVINVNANTIGHPSGWFFGLPLSTMALGGNGTTTTDAIDNIVLNGVGTYNSLVFTSGYREDTASTSPLVQREDIGLGTSNLNTAYLEWKRLIVNELDSNGYTGPVIFRISQEGYNANDDVDLSGFTRQTRIAINAAKLLEKESLPLDVYHVPDAYIWYRLAVGNEDGVSGRNGPQTPVPTASSFTHPASQQSGNQNYAWLQRSQNNSAGNTTNGHQSLVGAIINVVTWCYSIYGIDPQDAISYFALPYTLPLDDSNPTELFISANGARIYGGQNSSGGGAGFQGIDPYNNNGSNPGADPDYGAGPFDTDLDFAWTSTFRSEIADRVRGAVEDFYAGTTGFELA